ncbi:12945_t:CDS:2, partial [Acaulospora morrowiae]
KMEQFMEEQENEVLAKVGRLEEVERAFTICRIGTDVLDLKNGFNITALSRIISS